jgi:hypothetical protein
VRLRNCKVFLSASSMNQRCLGYLILYRNFCFAGLLSRTVAWILANDLGKLFVLIFDDDWLLGLVLAVLVVSRHV